MGKLETFEKWRPGAGERLVKLGFAVEEFNSVPSLNPSKGLYFKSDSFEATLMVWEYGDVVPEAYSLKQAKFVDVERKPIGDGGMEALLEDYLEQILRAHEV